MSAGASGSGPAAESTPAAGGSQRLDKWLWFARIVKSRTLAATLISEGKVRVNREKVEKPSVTVKSGDVVTSTIHRDVRIYRVVAPGVRRGPATEAQTLYEDLTPPPPPAEERPAHQAQREVGSGRPTKKDRRLTDRFRGR